MDGITGVTLDSMNVRKKVDCQFVDLEKVYDKETMVELWDVFHGIDGWLLNVLKVVHDGYKMCQRSR